MTGTVRIEEYLRARIEAGDFPGASYLVAEGDRILAEGALGLAVQRPERIPATTTTLYDLASLTKPLAGALVAARLSLLARFAHRSFLVQSAAGQQQRRSPVAGHY